LSDPYEQQLATELDWIARAAAAKLGRGFEPVAYGMLRQLTQDAATEALSPSRFGSTSISMASRDVETRKNEARAAVQKLVDAIAAEAATLPRHEVEAGVVGEQTLRAALARFCPCWPIC
jgi:hypothetical protein